MHQQQSNLTYGLGWVFFDAFLAFAGLMIMKFEIRSFNRPGIPVVTFLVSGLIPWLMFQSVYSLPEGAIKRGRTLLSLPIVTELDLVLAGTARVFTTYVILFLILSTCSSFYEDLPFPRFPLGVALLFIDMAVMGVALGLILMTLTRLYAPAGKFTGFFLRFGMIISGVIFPLTLFPPSIWPYLTWNPLLHVEELLRTYWLYAYTSPIGSASFVAECTLGMLFVGLLLERYVRRRLPPQ